MTYDPAPGVCPRCHRRSCDAVVAAQAWHDIDGRELTFAEWEDARSLAADHATRALEDCHRNEVDWRALALDARVALLGTIPYVEARGDTLADRLANRIRELLARMQVRS